jgi:hypothetical protein
MGGLRDRGYRLQKAIGESKMKTISDYPLLVGELLRRAEMRQKRRVKWNRIIRRLFAGKVWFIPHQ